MVNYDINNKRIFIAECQKCGNQVDVTNLMMESVNGVKTCCEGLRSNSLNSRKVLDKISNCCDKPDYY